VAQTYEGEALNEYRSITPFKKPNRFGQPFRLDSGMLILGNVGNIANSTED
jgi:hypothetical protein